MLFYDLAAFRKQTPGKSQAGKPISLRTQIACGLAAMGTTMMAMLATLPPEDVTSAGQILAATTMAQAYPA